MAVVALVGIATVLMVVVVAAMHICDADDGCGGDDAAEVVGAVAAAADRPFCRLGANGADRGVVGEEEEKRRGEKGAD